MMTSSAVWNAVFVIVFVNTFAYAEVTLRDFSGVWSSTLDLPTVNFFIPEGQGAVCRNTLSPDCDAEITPAEMSFTFTETTLAFEVRDRIGITDVNKSALLHPSCAKDGILPAERIVPVPESEILSYDSKAERIYFVDPRRPDDINCMIAKYRVGENGPYIEVTNVDVYQGSIPNLFLLGISFRCELPPLPCRLVIDDNGNLDFTLLVQFNLTCIAGDCFKTPVSAPTPLNSIDESPVDV